MDQSMSAKATLGPGPKKYFFFVFTRVNDDAPKRFIITQHNFGAECLSGRSRPLNGGGSFRRSERHNGTSRDVFAHQSDEKNDSRRSCQIITTNKTLNDAAAA